MVERRYLRTSAVKTVTTLPTSTATTSECLLIGSFGDDLHGCPGDERWLAAQLPGFTQGLRLQLMTNSATIETAAERIATRTTLSSIFVFIVTRIALLCNSLQGKTRDTRCYSARLTRIVRCEGRLLGSNNEHYRHGLRRIRDALRGGRRDTNSRVIDARWEGGIIQRWEDE